MDFPQQIEETLVERPPTAYDVVMESPLCLTAMDCKMSNKLDKSGSDKMSSSLNSTLEDTTPSDSGVQLLDSESSELMVESITSQNGFEFDTEQKVGTTAQSKFQSPIQELRPVKVEQFQCNALPVDSNSNVTMQLQAQSQSEAPVKTTMIATAPTSMCDDDVMTASACSTFDTTENIVYRRKVRKTPSAANKAPKKRVSFHEDILKNTRTDNIHIEHGFITYKNGRKMATNAGPGRYSWCSEGQTDNATKTRHAELCTTNSSPDEENESYEGGAGGGGNGGGAGRRRHVVYRNACSDVLDYGDSDVYDTNEPSRLQYDNSGVFEYLPRQAAGADGNEDGSNNAGGEVGEVGKGLYRCSCSSSNSSLDSDEIDKNSNRQQKSTATTYAGGQGKSSSCDCVLGSVNNANNNFIGDNCYYSEPNIDNLNERSVTKKSVWNKEKKPKSSCLKKTKHHTNVIHEQDLSTKMKKFNVHDMNQLLDNSSKMLFGSLKSIFTMPLPERGVPEGSEDLQAVVECLSELEQTPEHKANQNTATKIDSPTSPIMKAKPFLSKSLDGTKAQQGGIKKFVHNVDEQLRRKNTEELYAPTRQCSAEKTEANVIAAHVKPTPVQRQMEIEYEVPMVLTAPPKMSPPSASQPFRNKFIIDCESTVFEHTGVSYEAQQHFDTMIHRGAQHDEIGDDNETFGVAVAIADDEDDDDEPKDITPIAQPEPDQLRSAFYTAPIAKTFSNFFRSFKEATTSTPNVDVRKQQRETTKKLQNKQMETDARRQMENYCAPKFPNPNPIKQVSRTTLPTTISSSTLSSDMSTSTSSSNAQNMKKAQLIQQQQQKTSASICSNNSLVLTQDLRLNIEKQSRHLPSPLKKRSSGNNLMQPQRYGQNGQNYTAAAVTEQSSLLSPELYNSYNHARGGSGRDSKSTILSEEFDDILTITTDTDKNESDIVIVDYPTELNDFITKSSSTTATTSITSLTSPMDYSNLLKPPAAKTSLINRFLRNVTQKKILETSMRRNNFFASKLKNEQKLLTGQLYVRGMRTPINYELIDDLNAEIAMEIEMSGANSPRRELTSIDSSDLPGDASRFELGIGEISIDIFNGNYLHILRDTSEQLMKVFKLYTGYSREGYMTPVLVFLTDRTLYVTDLVRNRLCTKFVLPYVDLDVILLGPSGNTVLLSNSERDMQQVLLAGGPYPADGLVANLELCARRSGSTLPAVGQLTLEHLAPLRAFVRQHSCVGKTDAWMYYAVVNVPASSLGTGATACGAEKEPLGPHVKGFLMHRRIKDNIFGSGASIKQNWNPGYFLLKAGVLYMFNDSMQKLPSWAMALAECQGARRALKAGRPHCFEIMLRGGELLQMAAPDEYVASEWLQALLQSASGLFEMQEKHKTLGCTLVVTQNHLITLREDFAAPLRKINKTDIKPIPLLDERQQNTEIPSSFSGDTGSVLSSAKSTPTKAQFSCSSVNSTPTKLSQISRSTATTTGTTTSNTLTSPSVSSSIIVSSNKQHKPHKFEPEGDTESYSNMSSVYGKNSGIEILTCADIKEMTGIKIPSHNDTWWCILEFSCQEVCESSDDLVIFFASSAEMQRFLRLLEQLWQAKNNDLFPITVLDEDELIAEQCTMLYMDINRSWEPLLSAALGYPL